MTEQQWRPLAEVTQESLLGDDQALHERLSIAVGDLSLPPAILERLQRAVSEARQRASQRDCAHAARLIVSVQVTPLGSDRPYQSWGFFLVEKHTADGVDYRIDVFLYPEGN